MVDGIKPHIIGITESWANNDITDTELGLEGYAGADPAFGQGGGCQADFNQRMAYTRAKMRSLIRISVGVVTQDV